MNLIPWRVRNALSGRFPLLYHLAVNLGRKGNSPEYWDDRLAETWNDETRLWPSKNAIIESLTRDSDVILDVGCGTGGILRALKAHGYGNLHGLEISDYAVRRLREEGIEMHRGMLHAAGLVDCAFDVVIASQVLEHIIRRRRFLKEIRRILKPGGRAFIFVPDNCLGPISEPEHAAMFNARSLRRCLTPHFNVLNVESMKDPNYSIPILFALAERPLA